MFGQRWVFNSPPPEWRQPILRTALSGEVAHTLQLAQVRGFLIDRAPGQPVALAAVVERTQP